MTQLSYSRLFGGPDSPATRAHRPYASDTMAREARDRRWAELRSRGVPAHRFTLRGQMRQYWSMGEWCGETCSVFKIDIPREYSHD